MEETDTCVTLMRELEEHLVKSFEKAQKLIKTVSQHEKQNTQYDSTVQAQSNASDAASSRINALRERTDKYAVSVNQHREMIGVEQAKQKQKLLPRIEALSAKTSALDELYANQKDKIVEAKNLITTIDPTKLIDRAASAQNRYNDIDQLWDTLQRDKSDAETLAKERVEDDAKLETMRRPLSERAYTTALLSYNHIPGTQMTFIDYDSSEEQQFATYDDALKFVRDKVNAWEKYYPMYTVMYKFSDIRFSADQGKRFVSTNNDDTFANAAWLEGKKGSIVFLRIKFDIVTSVAISGEINEDDDTGYALYVYHDTINIAICCILVPKEKLYARLAQAIESNKFVYIVWSSPTRDVARDTIKGLHEAFGERAKYDSLQPYGVDRFSISYVGCQPMIYREGFEQKDDSISSRLVIDHDYALISTPK